MFDELYQYLKTFMIQNSWADEYTRNDARSIFTTICLYFHIDADTLTCDQMLDGLYDAADMQEVDVGHDEFENYMLAFIV